MKVTGIFLGAMCLLSMNAFAEERIQGLLVKSDSGVQLINQRGCGIEIVYDLLPAGNTCGRAITEGQLESNIGAVVELTGFSEGPQTDAGGGKFVEKFTVQSFPDGSRVNVIEPAPAQPDHSS